LPSSALPAPVVRGLIEAMGCISVKRLRVLLRSGRDELLAEASRDSLFPAFVGLYQA
jgi:hypothetical protein